MRSLSYLKQLTINYRGTYWFRIDRWMMQIAILSEQHFIIECNSVIEQSTFCAIQTVNLIRKMMFPNKRFHWKRKRRIGL